MLATEQKQPRTRTVSVLCMHLTGERPVHSQPMLEGLESQRDQLTGVPKGET